MASHSDIRPDDAQGIAEAREGIALTSALALDRRAMLESLQLVVDRAAQQARARWSKPPRSCCAIWSASRFGSSEIEPPQKDARFKDDSWRDNPIFRRMGQGYLAWGRSVDQWLERSNFDDLERERARFMLDIMKDLAAPMNSLVGNPEAVPVARGALGRSRAGTPCARLEQSSGDLSGAGTLRYRELKRAFAQGSI